MTARWIAYVIGVMVGVAATGAVIAIGVAKGWIE